MILISTSAGILEYMFYVSNDTNLRFCLYRIPIRSFMRCTECFTMKAFGNGIFDGINLLRNFASLYAGALCKFIRVRLGSFLRALSVSL